MSVPEAINAAEPTAEADLSGRQLAGFRLLRRLGRGAMAEVYLAAQESLGRQVAIKLLKSTLAADGSYVRRFQNEARAAAALVHANIVQIYEVGSVDGLHFIAQEYVQGLNLQE
ncbi:MAG: protein kinase domain-containing protein, partial [Pirellulales bacterium]